VDSYKSQAMERGICMRFLSNHVGNVNPAHPGNNLYQGMAIVFRRCNQPAIDESPFVSAANEVEEMPTVAADAYAVDHRGQGSVVNQPASEEEEMPTVAADASAVDHRDQERVPNDDDENDTIDTQSSTSTSDSSIGDTPQGSIEV
jgi:hypothetical protein